MESKDGPSSRHRAVPKPMRKLMLCTGVETKSKGVVCAIYKGLAGPAPPNVPPALRLLEGQALLESG